jgi:alkaline phosphatase D
MSVRIGRVESREADAGVGFRIGIRSDLNEYRSNCFAGGGLNAGLVNGQLALVGQRRPLDGDIDLQDFSLHLSGEPAGEFCVLTLAIKNAAGETVDSISNRVNPERILGNVALVNNFHSAIPRQLTPEQRRQGARHRFRDWTVGGEAFVQRPERAFGPILWSMYSLSDSRSDEGFVLKLSALTGPLRAADHPAVELHVRRGGGWTSLGTAELDSDAWTATFRIPHWEATSETPYKLVFRETGKDGQMYAGEWSGTIKANPQGRPLRNSPLYKRERRPRIGFGSDVVCV